MTSLACVSSPTRSLGSGASRCRRRAAPWFAPSRRRLGKRGLGTRRLAGDPPLKVSELEQAVGVSERTPREAFCAFEGLSPKDHLMRLRWQSVKEFVDTGMARDAPMTEIAERFGFSNAGRFARQFRIAIGDAKRQAVRA